MAERQRLGNPVGVSPVHGGCPAQPAPTLGFLALHQMTSASEWPKHFTAGSNLKTFRGRFLGLNAFWTSHKLSAFSKKSAQYTGALLGGQVVFCLCASENLLAEIIL